MNRPEPFPPSHPVLLAMELALDANEAARQAERSGRPTLPHLQRRERALRRLERALEDEVDRAVT